jgi:hypothetical protein
MKAATSETGLLSRESAGFLGVEFNSYHPAATARMLDAIPLSLPEPRRLYSICISAADGLELAVTTKWRR